MPSLQTRKKIIFVLGMHRSGTSAVTKGLESLGVSLGENLLPGIAHDNDKGYFEDVDFNRLNIDILAATGNTWESLRPLVWDDFSSKSFDVFRDAASRLILEKLDRGLYCVKDPRFAVLLPFWLDVLSSLNVEPLFVLAIRNPLEVVHSLQNGFRGEIFAEEGYNLWLTYNVQALHFIATFKSVVVSFDAMLRSPVHELKRIAQSLGLTFDPSTQAVHAYQHDFLDQNQAKNLSSWDDLISDSIAPPQVIEVYSLLLKLSSDQARLSDSSITHLIQPVYEGLLQNRPLYQYADTLKAVLNSVGKEFIGPVKDTHLKFKNRNLELQLADLKARNAALLETNYAHEASIGQYHDALTSANQSLANIYKSRSWRITAPIRSIVYKARRVKWLTTQIYRMADPLVSRTNLIKVYWLIRDHGLVQAFRIVSQKVDQLSSQGSSQGSNPASISAQKVEDYLPSEQKNLTAEYAGTVDVIIPVYKGIDFTTRCIESVLGARTNIAHRVIVINDCSPEPAVTAYIDSLKNNTRLTVLDNGENLGFVKTVNKGMRLSKVNDVLLLNSDTEVADHWLERIVAHALINPKVATITPFSNNATICSFPTIYGQRTLPIGITLEKVNDAFYGANKHASVSVPTGVGFCMYISRACLNEIGLFDDAAFGKGYGEENDFCMRAQANGWRNLLACDVYVFHAGEVSFQDSSAPGKKNALRVISRRYPDYELLIRDHIILAEAERFRIRAAARIFKSNGKTTWLMVNHALGGGTQKHLHELINVIGSEINIISINPVLTREHLIQAHLLIQNEKLTFSFDCRFDGARFIEFLSSCGCVRIHYHHIIGFLPEFLEHLRNYDAPFDFTVHDYYTICPKINLIKGDSYCGELGIAQCNICLSESRHRFATEIVAWRNRHSWLITDAQRVICPSDDTLQRMRRYYPTGHFVKRYHEDVENPKLFQKSVIRNRDSVRVAILGSLSVAKGANLVRDLLSLIHTESVNVSIHLIGSSEGLIRPRMSYHETGPYNPYQLESLLEEANADLILFPGRIPETYSYTLTEAMRFGLPILAPDVGAFPERLAYYPLGRIYGYQCNAKAILEHILNLHETELELESSQIIPIEPRSVESFYKQFYLKAGTKTGMVDLRSGRGRSAVIIAESIGANSYSPCAYIRLILPLMNNEFGVYESVKIVDASEALNYIADDFYTHRISVDQNHVDDLLIHCKAHNIKLIYDIDDDLLGIAKSDHPERKFYATYASVITQLVQSADEVFVSTASLADGISELRTSVEIRPNKLSREVIPLTWQKTAQKPIGVLYMGTLTHGADFQLVEDALTRIKDIYGASVALYIIGVTTRAVNSKYFNVLTPPPELASSYPLFMQWMGGLNLFDIGIAPLERNPFNLHKSDIKFLDYSALKIATVASNVEAYASTIIDQETGLLVDNKSEAWVDALSMLISSAETRRRMADNAYAYLQAQRSY